MVSYPAMYDAIDQRIASALAAERQTVVPALRGCIDDLLDRER